MIHDRPDDEESTRVSTHASGLAGVGAFCFGLVVGYITYRTLIRTTDKASIADLGAVIGAIGGAAVTGLFKPGTDVFAWYSIGLAVGLAGYFLLFGVLNGFGKLAQVMGAPPVVWGGDPKGDNTGPAGSNQPQG
jgi:hypothetical protein